MAPPYLFSSVQVGLMQIAAIIGFVLGTFGGGWLADVVTAKRILKYNGRVSPELRLFALIPAAWVGPLGCIILAVACSRQLHWALIAFAFGLGRLKFLSTNDTVTKDILVSFATVYTPNIAITYIVESFPASASESVVIINAGKNLVAFIFLFVAVDWVHSQGWIQVYMIMFMVSTISILLSIPLYAFGSKGRQWAHRTCKIM